MREMALQIDGLSVRWTAPRAVDLACVGALSERGIERQALPALLVDVPRPLPVAIEPAPARKVGTTIGDAERLITDRDTGKTVRTPGLRCLRFPPHLVGGARDCQERVGSRAERSSVADTGTVRTPSRNCAHARSSRRFVGVGPHIGASAMRARLPIADRFWSKVEKSEGCCLWTASARPDGYGRLVIEHGKQVAAHRFSYELHHGAIPPGLLVMHTCDVRRCVNPAHLRVGTHHDNTHDAMAKGRLRVGEFQLAKTHCVRGHPFDAENTIVSQRPGRGPERSCRECGRMRCRTYRAKVHEAVAS